MLALILFIVGVYLIGYSVARHQRLRRSQRHIAELAELMLYRHALSLTKPDDGGSSRPASDQP